ncbi:ubiquitin-associated domain-containing protein 1 [Palaemon carinicauda]|uniref:ubiquitin-associated domain-containing protein 1 n=1 Tax=Palaemon carinicauda TaxID=392227 RepID=UPI0035B5DF9F
MISWLKRKAKVTINNRYVNLLRSSNNLNANMYVPEPQTVSRISDHMLKLTVINTECHTYSLEVQSGTTVQRVKIMAVGHFFGPQEAMGGGAHVDERPGVSKSSGNRTFRLVLVRDARPLSDDNALHFEKLIDNDNLLLVERREPPPLPLGSSEDISSPKPEQIDSATAHLPRRNESRDLDSTNISSDFQTELRRILVTMIEASVRLISADPESKDVFGQILEKLERRHRPKVDRNHLKQLVEMGFDETKATKALQLKRDFNDAVEWLLDDKNFEGNELRATNESGSFASDYTTDRGSKDDQQEDPAKRILRQFLQYRRKWFQPNQQALQKLREMGYPEDRIVDALRVNGNNEDAARELLCENKDIPPDDVGLERNSPIISAILASPVIQLALPKPKTLLALMMLFESPTNANMWLSDPDTHPVVSQVLRIYHAEKHSLNHKRSVSGSSSTLPSSAASSSTEYHQPFSRSTTPPRNNSSTGTGFSVRNDGHSHQLPHASFIRNSSNGSFRNDIEPNLQWSPGTPGVSGHIPSVSSTVLSPHIDPLPNSRTSSLSSHIPLVSSLVPSRIENRIINVASSQQRQTGIEEPMSHSGSPVRGMFGYRTVSGIANGGPRQLSETITCESGMAHTNTSTTADIEMLDSNQDSQAMDTQ